MTAGRFYFCALPPAAWEHGGEVARFVEDALGCEKRIAKEVNLENEYPRYTLCCQLIEQEVIQSGKLRSISRIEEFTAVLANGFFPSLAMDVSYLDLLSVMLSDPGNGRSEGRLAASFFPPDHVGRHRVAFARWAEVHTLSASVPASKRMAFLEAAERAGCGVVEIYTAFHPPSGTGEADLRQPEGLLIGSDDMSRSEDAARFISIPEFEREGLGVEGFNSEKRGLANTLRRHIREALANGEPVAFGNEAQHDVIAEVLNETVFVPEGELAPGVQMRVMYADGSEAEPFPLLCLPRVALAGESAGPNLLGAPGRESVTPLRVALMSMRHLELDPEIDYCWFRNRDVSRTRSLAETDRFCYRATLAQLRDSLELGDLVIHLYHTGFEPAVIGFYRGVVHTLLELKRAGASGKAATGNRLAVVPYYFRGRKGYVPGSEWG